MNAFTTGAVSMHGRLWPRPMRRPLFLTIAVASLALSPTTGNAADSSEVRGQIDDLKRSYATEFERMRQDYDNRLAELEDRVKKAESLNAQTVAQPTAQPLPPTGAAASPGAFNPAIGVVLNGTFGAASHDPDNAKLPGFQLGDDAASRTARGFSLGESEVNLNANVDQALFANLTLTVPSSGESIGVEEAFIQTTSLPYNLTLKAGRFFSAIGYLNEQHAHAWDFADAPLPYRAMLNNQLGDDGVQMRWGAPITDYQLELGAEGFRGAAFPANGSANGGKGGFSLFNRLGGDVGTSHSWQTSLAWLRTRSENRDGFTGDDDTAIAGLVWKWAPEGNPVERNLKLQGEYFYRLERGDFTDASYTGRAQGYYAQAVYQFMPQWATGLRYDSVWSDNKGLSIGGSDLDSLGHTPRRGTTMLQYTTSEFGRIRGQYSLDDSLPKLGHEFLLQYTISLGAHGAHLF